MDDKNELNDLLLGNQKESSSSKKFFLIAAGVLLLFFIIIGIMKFMGSSETKQPLPITSTEQLKKLPEPELNATVPKAETNATPTKADNNTANAAGDEKLNAIVKKLQQDAQNQANTPSPTQAQVAPSEPVAVVTKQPVAQKQTTETAQPKQQPKTTVVTVPIKTAPIEQVQPQKQKEPTKKEDVKTAFKDATKNVAKPKTQPQAQPKQPAKQPKTGVATASGIHFIQVGYFESEAAAKGLRDKVNSVGFGSTTRQAVKNDKNVTKVWVGPFESKEEAAKAMPKIREQIKSDAFVVKG